MTDSNSNHVLTLELTQKCPLACIHCSSISNPLANCALPFEAITGIIEEAAKRGYSEISLSGGEPFSHTSLLDTVGFALNRGIRSIVYTSGVCDGTKPIGRPVLQRLVDLRARLAISLHSHIPRTHEQITKTEGSFDSTLRTIDTARELGIAVGVHFVPMSPNWSDLPGVMRLAFRNSLDYVRLLRFVPQGRGSANRQSLSLSATEWAMLRDLIWSLRAEYGSFVQIGHPLLPLVGKSSVCVYADRIHINSDGSAYPCEAFKGIYGYRSGIYATHCFGDAVELVQKARQENDVLGCPAQALINCESGGDLCDPLLEMAEHGGVSCTTAAL